MTAKWYKKYSYTGRVFMPSEPYPLQAVIFNINIVYRYDLPSVLWNYLPSRLWHYWDTDSSSLAFDSLRDLLLYDRTFFHFTSLLTALLNKRRLGSHFNGRPSDNKVTKIPYNWINSYTNMLSWMFYKPQQSGRYVTLTRH